MQTTTTLTSQGKIITEVMLDKLPEPVRRYLFYTGVVGQPWIDTARLKYKGVFRMDKDKPWMPMRAEQVYMTNPPGFQWKAHFSMFGLPLLYGQDTYKDGQGHMFGKLAGLKTVFDVRGAELVQGTMLRYLQEMMWFPIAYLSDYITWDAVDDHAADATFTYGTERVTGRMYFDDAGRAMNFVAQRYRETQGTFSLDTWTTPISEYSTFAGLRLPFSGQATWLLPAGDLTYIKLEIAEVTYNVPIPAF